MRSIIQIAFIRCRGELFFGFGWVLAALIFPFVVKRPPPDAVIVSPLQEYAPYLAVVWAAMGAFFIRAALLRARRIYRAYQREMGLDR